MSRTTNEERLSVIETKIDTMANDIHDIKKSVNGLDKKYATIERVSRVEQLTFWLMGILGTAAGSVITYLLLQGL